MHVSNLVFLNCSPPLTCEALYRCSLKAFINQDDIIYALAINYGI